MSASSARGHRRGPIVRWPSRVGYAALALAGVALPANALPLERAPRPIPPAKKIIAANRSLLPAPAIVRACSLDGFMVASLLPGMNLGFMGAARPPLVASFEGTAVSSTDASGYSLTSAPIGSADVRRFVALLIYARSGAGILSSGSVGGVDFTILESEPSPSHTFYLVVTDAPVPTGTTATIALTFSGTVVTVVVGIYRLVSPGNLVVVDKDHTSPASPTNPTLTMGRVVGSVVIAGAVCTTGPAAWSWPTLTEDYDAVTETRNVSFAHLQSDLGADLAVEPTNAAAVAKTLIAGTFR